MDKSLLSYINWGLLACMLLAMMFDYRQLRNLAWPFFFLTIFLLLLVPIAGKTVYGAKRWISLGFMSLQPSELAKLSVLVLAARLLARDSRPLGWKDFFSVFFICLLPCALSLRPRPASRNPKHLPVAKAAWLVWAA